ncbi:MAG: tRNA pseudouridine(38-40) synthase TruA [Eubacteriales bacterium]
MKRVKLVIAYDGTNYNGWQIQKNAVTIQQVLEDACQKLFSQEIKLIGASRTDTGVHALGQVAVFDVDTTIPSNRIAYALNTYLPEDIIIQDSQKVRDEFHPRYEAKRKTYEYVIVNQNFMIPQYRHYSYFIPKKLDTKKINQASKYLIGEHDFKAFCSAHSSVKNTIRTICDIKIKEKSPFIRINITGDGFLYNMVRIIVGTLVDIGLSRKLPEEMITIIKDKDRKLAGATAPAKALCLKSIIYD